MIGHIFSFRKGAKIPRMAIYRFSEDYIAGNMRKFRSARLWVGGLSGFLLTFDLYLMFDRTSWLAEHIRLPYSVSNTLLILLSVLFFQIFDPWRSTTKDRAKFFREYSVEITPESVQILCGKWSTVTRRDEIIRIEEPNVGVGLYLRTANRYRSLIIPRNLDGYREIKAEFDLCEVPYLKTVLTPNWELFLLILLICGSLICDWATRNQILLWVNLFVALLAGVGGFLIINANPDNRTRMRWSRFGALFPFVVAILALIGWLP